MAKESTCAWCEQPLRGADGTLVGRDGRLYCSEKCANRIDPGRVRAPGTVAVFCVTCGFIYAQGGPRECADHSRDPLSPGETPSLTAEGRLPRTPQALRALRAALGRWRNQPAGPEGRGPRDFGELVFERIARHWLARVDDLTAIARSGYSFEEWANWEAVFACMERKEWQARPRPRYATLGIDGGRDHADLVVAAATGGAVVLEVAVSHSFTNVAKWREKVEVDAEKLDRARKAGTPGLQIVFVLATGTEEDRHRALHRLDGVSYWDRANLLFDWRELGSEGIAMVRGHPFRLEGGAYRQSP